MLMAGTRTHHSIPAYDDADIALVALAAAVLGVTAGLLIGRLLRDLL